MRSYQKQFLYSTQDQKIWNLRLVSKVEKLKTYKVKFKDFIYILKPN
jgi:hypothetical protein